MADLGLAIIGVASTAAALAKQLLDVYQSAKESYTDAWALANHLQLLQSILQEIEKTFTSTRRIWSDDAMTTIEELLTASRAIFVRLDKVLNPYNSSEAGTNKTSLVSRFKWHFKKEEVRSLTAQLDSIKSTMQLMLSVILLGDRMDRDDGLSLALQARLYMASQLVAGERASLANLLLVEEYIAVTTGAENGIAQGSAIAQGTMITQGPMTRQLQQINRDGRIFEWLNSIVGLSQDGGLPFDTQSRFSSKSRVVLTDEQRSIAGAACNDVENLLEKWTTLSESQSKRSEREWEEEQVPRQSLTHRPSSHIIGTSASNGDLQQFAADGNVRNDVFEPEQIHAHSRAIENNRDDDDKTVRDFTGHEETHIPHVESVASTTIVEDWIIDQASEEGDPNFRSQIRDQLQQIPYHRGPFSEISILEPSGSQAPSEISTISSIGTSSDPKRIRKLIKLGRNLFKLKKFTEALTLYREAYQEKKELGEEDAEMLEIEFQLGVIFGELNKYPEAEKLLQRVLKKQKRRQAGAAMHLTEHYLGRVLARQCKWKEAFTIYTPLWQIRKVALEDADKSAINLALKTGCEYGNVVLETEMYDEALGIAQLIYPLAKERFGKSDIKVTIRSGLDLARSYVGVGSLPEARKLISEIYDVVLESYGSESLFLTDCSHELAMVACKEGKYEEAESLARRALDLRRRRQGRRNIYTLESAHRLALILQLAGKLANSKAVLEEYQQISKKLLGKVHPITIKLTLQLAKILEEEENTRGALSILSSAYDDVSASKDTPKQEMLSVAIPLGQLILKDTERLTEKKYWDLRRNKTLQATKIYSFIYSTQKEYSGPRSEISLETGHQYGVLCIGIGQYDKAEAVLKEVWENKGIVFGKSDPRSIASGMKLGQVFLCQRKHEQALQTFEPLFDTCGALTCLSQSEQNIKSAELLGLVELSRARSWDQVNHGWMLMENSLEARKQLSGPTPSTLLSSIEWAFTQGARDPDDKKHALGIVAGFNASLIAFIRKDRPCGNDILAQIIQSKVQRFGYSSTIRVFTYAQAALLFFQQERKECVYVLRRFFNELRREFGSSFGATRRAGQFLSLALIIDSLLTSNTVSGAVDKLVDKMVLVEDVQPIIIPTCVSIAILLAKEHMESLAKPLLQWVYKTFKRQHGLFSSEALTILAIMHVISIRKTYQRAKGVPKSDYSFQDIGAQIHGADYMWNPMINRISRSVSKLSQNPEGHKFFARFIANGLARATLWEKFDEYLASLEINRIIQESVHTNGFGEEILFNLRQNPSYRVGRAETIYEDSDSDDGREIEIDDAASIDFGGILDSIDSQPLRSLGASLVDLTMKDENGDEVVGRISHLQDELINEIINEADIKNARENVDEFEKEAGLQLYEGD
ncbi:hypothetical protein B7463_g11922, partial [Scytalidium lignicola]